MTVAAEEIVTFTSVHLRPPPITAPVKSVPAVLLDPFVVATTVPPLISISIDGVLPFAAVQRLVQCLGAFGRLASVGQPQFGKFVLPALERLLAAADEANLDATGALAEDLIAEEGHHHHHHK